MAHFHRCPDCGCDTRCPAPDQACEPITKDHTGVSLGAPLLDESCAKRRRDISRGLISPEDTRP